MLEAETAYEVSRTFLRTGGTEPPTWEELSLEEKDYWQALVDEANEADYAKS